MISKKYVKSIKNYNSEDFSRAMLQLFLSQKLKSFPKIKIDVYKNVITQTCNKIDYVSFPKSKIQLKKLWLDFKSDINLMHVYGYIHGDILLKNILFDGSKFVLVDHELRLITNRLIKATYPWIHLRDYKNRSITYRTDCICMKATELRLFDDKKYFYYRKYHISKFINTKKLLSYSYT